MAEESNEEEKEETGEIKSVEDSIVEASPYYQARKQKKDLKAIDSVASQQHMLIYDSSSETLEPVYFWILDMMNKNLDKVEKLVDNFTSSPGSGHFSELMGKATHMQEQAMKIMQTNGILIKSMINIIYDLKEFEIRLSQYKSAKSENKEEKESGLLALKQIWMDNVDIKRGRGSINMMVQDLSFVTLRDAFMMINSLEEADKLDLNDRVKRILKPRLQEFLQWRELSEKELKKRYEIEKIYLKNQVDSLKMYTRWAKPYLRAALQLEQRDSKNPALVTAFNTIIFELTLLGTGKEADIRDLVANKKLPEVFKNASFKREYHPCVLVDFVFRGIPQKAGQHYVFGGRVEVTFKAYALNNEELDKFKKLREKSDMNTALKLASGMTDESLKELEEDISYFLKKDEERKKEKEEKKAEDINPFSALLGLEKKQEKKKDDEDKKDKEIKEVKKDSYQESVLRALTEKSAIENCYTIFDVYKKAHGMPSLPGLDWE